MSADIAKCPEGGDYYLYYKNLCGIYKVLLSTDIPGSGHIEQIPSNGTQGSRIMAGLYSGPQGMCHMHHGPP